MNEYISKKAILQHLNNCKEDPLFDHDMARICFAIGIFIENMKTADVQPVKHGKWIWDSNAPHREHGAYKCSNCGCHSDFEKNYCYNCGTRMDGGAKLQRLERCKKCFKSTEEDDFQGGTELYCPLYGYPCDMIIQCVYIPDNKRYE